MLGLYLPWTQFSRRNRVGGLNLPSIPLHSFADSFITSFSLSINLILISVFIPLLLLFLQHPWRPLAPHSPWWRSSCLAIRLYRLQACCTKRPNRGSALMWGAGGPGLGFKNPFSFTSPPVSQLPPAVLHLVPLAQLSIEEWGPWKINSRAVSQAHTLQKVSYFRDFFF